ncbi:5-dehydro-4-deoxy-D-glucuronate isomerase [Treponema parvum]|uniref:4-deoxy-L-threo-5-hexosulose-uronate ketol-isomerase n=1 Tax=Treponema parvum TaxID=138851 RepID=A0A975IGL8_9SPIR|nr:5-dehydro-4-deoxy-D-glucuronate isomerase [Treponema parvum]QTQ15194.1 5-dehydro-4-deoxy-D-glucuronate isomerase [Treponema parvum]
MDIRYSTGKEPFSRMNTRELRKEFLVTNIFKADEVSVVYSHIDRIVVMGAMPVKKTVDLKSGFDPMKDFGVDFFLQRREMGIINIGGSGTVNADGKSYKINNYDAMYIGAGIKDISFSSDDAKSPAKFYMTSSPAHTPYPVKVIPLSEAKHVKAGSADDANERTINQYIHPDVLDTCQLSMGLTHLEKGSVWNTMPAHTHERRMEVYFYFDVPENQTVFHFMGEPQETRHIIVHNDEAVINPSWSIHSGCGTTNYTFIWAMCGENRTYTDQDWIKTEDLR